MSLCLTENEREKLCFCGSIRNRLIAVIPHFSFTINVFSQMAAMNPQLGAALQNPQIRNMLSNPDFLRQMSDPATLQVSECVCVYLCERESLCVCGRVCGCGMNLRVWCVCVNQSLCVRVLMAVRDNNSVCAS